jgi:GrpB-like predicted nucleotidyltransferase (UPF0157 family)
VSLDDAIEIVDYDARWPARYGGERDRLRIALATADLCFEHIGSTAVPGLGGAPTVDLMLGAPAAVWAVAVDELRGRIATLGYEDLGEAGLPGRFAFRRRALRSFDLALVEVDGARWRDSLAVRDYLRANPEEAAAYAAAKRAAYDGGARTLLAYSQMKAPLIGELVAKARAAAARA